MEKWTRANYQPNVPLRGREYVTGGPAHRALARRAAREGAVLLKNDGGLLPIAAGERLALFGRGVFDYVRGGGGSGEVTVQETRTLYDGLKAHGDKVTLYEPLCDHYRADVAAQYAAGALPGMTREPALPAALLEGARRFTDLALIVLSRFSGEGWDRSDVEYTENKELPRSETTMPAQCARYYPRGDFYLTEGEEELVRAVTGAFPRVAVVLNIGGVMDTRWIRDDPRVGAALLIWQGGMEGADAAAELLLGEASPSGRLADTFAGTLEAYPSTAGFHASFDHVDYTEDIYVGYRYFETLPGKGDQVCYPFGWGLSYTEFDLAVERAWEEEEAVLFRVKVTNVGRRSGKEVVQLYYSAPQGLLGKPARALGAFAKTRELLPGESQTVTLTLQKKAMASYDDLGKVRKSAWVLEKGTYRFAVGTSVRAGWAGLTMELAEDVVTEQLTPKCVPTSLEERMLADGSFEALPTAPCNDMNACAIPRMKPGSEEGLTPEVRHRGRYMLWRPAETADLFPRAAAGELTLDEFLARLTDRELMELLGGQPNTSVANTFGFGGLPEYGVPSIMTADGPAGLRIQPGRGVWTTMWPCASLMACTWDPALAEEVGRAGGEEVKENNICVWLTPAVNIHRNPMCGRNFEYYSEDPLLAGKMGAAAVRGIQSANVGASVKHFACNDKETNRKNCDSRLSERALREIYLKAFEIIVKEADPWTIMSAYNAINGHRASENKELLEDILRGEWGFRGMVTTDWWTRGEHYKEVLAGNDVKMACGFPERLEAAMAAGVLTRADLEHCARRVLELILKID